MERRGTKSPVRKDPRKDPRKERLRRMLEGSIDRNVDPRDREEVLVELYERLEDPRTDAELGEHVLGVVFELICRDLGVEPDFESWSDQDLEIVVPTQAEFEAWEAAGAVGLPTGSVRPRPPRVRWSPEAAAALSSAADAPAEEAPPDAVERDPPL